MSFPVLLERIKRSLIPLDYESLLSAAIRRTGFKHPGDQPYEEALRVLVDSCYAEAGLSIAGQIAARQNLAELLETRLRLIDFWQRTPEIQKQAVSPQLVITGTPKSGSTFLHRLLGRDLNNRVPRMWEVMFPLPAPMCVAFDSDPRIRRTDKRLRLLRWTHPAIAQAHPLGASIPQECGSILGYSFESYVFLDMFSIPSYEAWLESRDMGPAYEFHLNFLRHLQWQCPPVRWVLKSSDHVHALATLIKTYPESRIIFLHRDPIKVLQAASSQMTLVKSVFSRSLNPRRLGDYEARTLYNKTRKIMEFRDNHAYLEEHFTDVRYLDLARDPVGTVKTIYDRFGLSLSAEDEERMEDFATAERNKQRPDRYSLVDFNLDPGREDPKFDLYCERFRVVREDL